MQDYSHYTPNFIIQIACNLRKRASDCAGIKYLRNNSKQNVLQYAKHFQTNFN